MKKIVSIALSMLMLASFPAINVSAAHVSTNPGHVIVVQDIYSVSKMSLLSISSSGTATCRSLFSDSNPNIYSIRIDQTLQKKSFGFFWSVDGASWSQTIYSCDASVTNYKSGLGNGTYRLKTVFTVTGWDGRSESVTVYSAERTVN